MCYTEVKQENVDRESVYLRNVFYIQLETTHALRHVAPIHTIPTTRYNKTL